MAVADDECHFTAPVRFGRRKTDQVGHLVMTTGWLTFRGTIDMRVGWIEVARIDRADNDMVVSLRDSRRILRFCCYNDQEAALGVTVGGHLIELARAQQSV